MIDGALRDGDYPADPYPGGWPGRSYVHHDGMGHPLHPDPTRFAGWRVGRHDLDDWLARRGGPPMARRVPMLAYGSNRCPTKITWLRREMGLSGPVVVLAARTEGVAAVWAAGLRGRDGQRPAVLAAAPGVVERHAVWLATPEQVSVLDAVEGRGARYRLARLRTGRVRTDDGAVLERPWCYLAFGGARRPLLVEGAPVRCARVPQATAAGLVGEVAAGDGLAADEVLGAPHPDQWPAALFAYGPLAPGRAGWPLVAQHVPAGAVPRPAWAAGARHDTGRGHPAMLLGRSPGRPARHRTRGTLIPLTDPAIVLPVLDDYQGARYRRVRLVLPDEGLVDSTEETTGENTGEGTVAWAYVMGLGPGGPSGQRPGGPSGQRPGGPSESARKGLTETPGRA